MKQTAVDWLVMKWATQGTLYSSDILQAKEMEKDQIERAYHQGVVNEISIYSTPDAEQYYKETYE